MSVNPQMGVEAPSRAAVGWYGKFKILLFIVFAFEIGFFLMLFPWLQGWDRTSVPVMIPWLSYVWDNAFFRGAISGLGAVNVYISLLEVGRLRRGG